MDQRISSIVAEASMKKHSSEVMKNYLKCVENNFDWRNDRLAMRAKKFSMHFWVIQGIGQMDHLEINLLIILPKNWSILLMNCCVKWLMNLLMNYLFDGGIDWAKNVLMIFFRKNGSEWKKNCFSMEQIVKCWKIILM